MRRYVYTLISILGIAALGVGIVAFFNHQSSAVTAAEWRAGNIISDERFYNNKSMTVGDIQNFLNSKVASCDTNGTGSAASKGYPNLTNAQYAAMVGWPSPPYVCLKDYRQVPDPTQIISNFQGSNPAGSISAAEIIKLASDTYGVSPQVFLVLIQKESLNLLNDTWPMLSQYRSALGYGCSDSAPCDAQYAGFYNQIMQAGRQFKLYKDNASSYRHLPFQNNSILFQANAPWCGSSTVYIENYATAGLYNYTPYQPNQAALNNLYGTGDACSAYGNRNFWRLFIDWFGRGEFDKQLISFRSHVSYVGWTNSITNNGITGTTGENKSLEAFSVNGEVDYSSYNVTDGWQPTVTNGMVSGTTGAKKTIQAIKVTPKGSLADQFDLYYRTHVSYIGWTGWAKNGAISGATGNPTNNIEAIEFRLVLKDSPAPGDTSNAYINNGTVSPVRPISITTESHVGNIGWQPAVRDGMISGTVDDDKKIEALKFTLNNSTGKTGSLAYTAQLAFTGWQDIKTSGEMAGTTGESRQMETIRMSLTGDLSASYDVWYRTYVQGLGWLGWAKNSNPAGSIGASKAIDGIETRILPKGSTELVEQGALYNPAGRSIPNLINLSYSSHVSFVGWMPTVSQDMITGTVGQSKNIESIKIATANSKLSGNISLECTVYVQGIGWTTPVSINEGCGTVGQTRPIEGIKLYLTGADAENYTVSYKTHLAWLGWQDWVKDGAISGMKGSDKNIQALIIQLQEK